MDSTILQITILCGSAVLGGVLFPLFFKEKK